MASFNLYHLFIGPCFPNTVLLGLGFQYYKFGERGHKHLVHKHLITPRIWFLDQQLHVSPGCLLEMQAIRPHPRPIELELLYDPQIFHIFIPHWEALLWNVGLKNLLVPRIHQGRVVRNRAGAALKEVWT